MTKKIRVISTPIKNKLTQEQIKQLFELTASTAELNELLKKDTLLQPRIEQATNTMKEALLAVVGSSLDYNIPEEYYTDEVQGILSAYKTECEKIAGHTNVLMKLVYASIITIAAALLGMVLAATVCTAIGIAATLGVVGGFAAGAALGYTSSIIGFFKPNKLHRGVSNVVDEAKEAASIAAGTIFTQSH